MAGCDPSSALLHRLRRFGAPPGRPAETLSVPVSPVEGAAAELAPVFAALDGLAAEADERRTRGRREAEAILAAARADAVRVRTAGARTAEQTRAAILASRRRGGGRGGGGDPRGRPDGGRADRARAADAHAGDRRTAADGDRGGRAMRAGWVAGAARARALLHRRLGTRRPPSPARTGVDAALPVARRERLRRAPAGAQGASASCSGRSSRRSYGTYACLPAGCHRAVPS